MKFNRDRHEIRAELQDAGCKVFPSKSTIFNLDFTLFENSSLLGCHAASLRLEKYEHRMHSADVSAIPL